MAASNHLDASRELEARAARSRARANAEVRVFHADEQEAMADANALYWDRIPLNDRATFVWQLSLEAFSLAHPGVIYEPRLSRLVARVLRG